MSTLRCVALAIEGAFRLEPQPVEDERGGFARLWCRDTLRAAGLDEALLAVMQTSASFNRRAGTLRGLHFAWPPAQEAKVVRCARGRMLDVLLDLRPGSPTWLRHVAVELDAANRHALYIPAGLAHGFQTLSDDAEILYMIDRPFVATEDANHRSNHAVVGALTVRIWGLPELLMRSVRLHHDFSVLGDAGVEGEVQLLVAAGLLAEQHAAPLQRLREHNPLLADLVIKRTLSSGGAKLPAAMFEGRALDTLASFRKEAA